MVIRPICRDELAAFAALSNAALIDIEGQAYRAYGLAGDALALIRPGGVAIIDYLHTVTG